MWCHDGKISLAGFMSGIITTIFTSQIVLTFFSLDLTTLQNVMLCFVGPIGTYALFCVITYFVTNENDFAVLYFINFFVQNVCILWNIFIHFAIVFSLLDNKKSYGPGCLFWTISNNYVPCTKCLETAWCLLFLHDHFSLQ